MVLIVGTLTIRIRSPKKKKTSNYNIQASPCVIAFHAFALSSLDWTGACAIWVYDGGMGKNTEPDNMALFLMTLAVLSGVVTAWGYLTATSCTGDCSFAGFLFIPSGYIFAVSSIFAFLRWRDRKGWGK